MEEVSPWRKLRQLGVQVPAEFAVLPPIVLDRISTAWVLGPGHHLLIHYKVKENLVQVNVLIST